MRRIAQDTPYQVVYCESPDAASCFSWKIRNDGPCKLSDVQSSCGAGRQHRIIECAKWDGVGDILTLYSS